MFFINIVIIIVIIIRYSVFIVFLCGIKLINERTQID